MTDEILEVVDDNDIVISTEKRSLVYKKGLLHRASHIFIQNDKGEIYIQRRSKKRKTWPDKWDLSAAETLKPGESYEQGALRGLREELEITGINVKLLCDPYLANYHDEFSNLSPNVFVGLFLGKYNHTIIPDHKEVSEGKFMAPEDISKLFNANPKIFTSWFQEDFSRLKEIVF